MVGRPAIVYALDPKKVVVSDAYEWSEPMSTPPHSIGIDINGKTKRFLVFTFAATC